MISFKFKISYKDYLSLFNPGKSNFFLKIAILTCKSKWKELKEEVKKARSGSAPGPNIVYKRCPMLPISHQRAVYAACVTRPLVRDCNVTSEVMAAFPCNLEERDNTGMLEKG